MHFDLNCHYCLHGLGHQSQAVQARIPEQTRYNSVIYLRGFDRTRSLDVLEHQWSYLPRVFLLDCDY